MIENLVIRRMLETELQTASLIEEKCLGNEAWSYNSILDAYGKEYYYFFVALLNNKHIGTVLFTKSLDEADISNVCVLPEYRQNGVAYRLLSVAISSMIDEGVAHFTLEVREHNESALALYKKLSFESAGIRPGFYRNPDDNAVIMWKHI